MKKKEEQKQENEELQDFSTDVKRDILNIINDSPSLVLLGDKEYRVKNMRYYSVYRICKLVMDMRKADETLDDDNKVITALCTDLDAMCEIMAIVLCNHYFSPEGDMETFEDICSKNDRYISIMMQFFGVPEFEGLFIEGHNAEPDKAEEIKQNAIVRAKELGRTF